MDRSFSPLWITVNFETLCCKMVNLGIIRSYWSWRCFQYSVTLLEPQSVLQSWCLCMMVLYVPFCCCLDGDGFPGG